MNSVQLNCYDSPVIEYQAGKRVLGGVLSSTLISIPVVNIHRDRVQRGGEEVKIDFSNVNLEYLIHARDIAREDPEVAATLLGTSLELAKLLAQAPMKYLTKISQIKVPLMAARGDVTWWSRLFNAFLDENEEEAGMVLQAVNLSILA